MRGPKKRAARVIAFLEDLPITKGILAGTKMELLPDQREFVRRVYSMRGDGRRAVELAIKSEPKGNGKTGLIAGLALCHMLGPEAEERGEVYSAAIDRPQAALLFAEMEAIIFAKPEFAERVNITRFHKKHHPVSQEDGNLAWGWGRVDLRGVERGCSARARVGAVAVGL
jgi:phage terminase large subunit-like protein